MVVVKTQDLSSRSSRSIIKSRTLGRWPLSVVVFSYNWAKTRPIGLLKSNPMEGENTEKGRNMKNGKGMGPSYLTKMVCFSSAADDAGPVVPGPRFDRGVRKVEGEDGAVPTHLVVMVNGIVGSAGNWKFAAKQLVKRYPNDIVVFRSRCNSNTLTFHGVDVMGERLANEVLSVVKHCPEFKKISFVAHSLGGLIARFAIAKLYQEYPKIVTKENGISEDHEPGTRCLKEETVTGRIAGLEPTNFVSFATPHLGSRWHKQIPFLCGFHSLETVASHTSWILGRTGKHLCLADSDENKPPLLLQMVKDSGNLKFISALRSFKRRVAYSNARFDLIVGWKTSSIRRQNELPKRQQLKKFNSEYPHIVLVTTSEAVPSPEDLLKEKTESKDMEEAMIRGLNTVSWERVDVSFRKSIQRIMAHNTIVVKTRSINLHGADVIKHMIDHLII